MIRKFQSAFVEAIFLQFDTMAVRSGPHFDYKLLPQQCHTNTELAGREEEIFKNNEPVSWHTLSKVPIRVVGGKIALVKRIAAALETVKNLATTTKQKCVDVFINSVYRNSAKVLANE